MTRVVLAVIAVVVFHAVEAHAAPPQGDVVIRTRAGQNKLGRVVTETATGYLLAGPDGTEVVPFSEILDIRQLAQPAYAPPAPAVDAATYYPPPAAYPPPPPPLAYAPPQVSALNVEDWLERRSGFHFGLGVTGMGMPVGWGMATGALQFNFDWTFGRTGLRVAPQVGFYQERYGYFLASVDTTLQVNVASHFAFGIGVQLGLAAGPYTKFFVAPTLAPVIVKMGDRGEHQLQLTVSLPVLQIGTFSYYGSDGFGYPLGGIGYAYLF